MRILDEDGPGGAAGQVGEICGRGPLMMAGYYKRPDLTATGHRRRLAPLGRSRLRGRGRLPLPRRPEEGHDHLGRRQRLPAGHRGGRRPAPRRARGGGLRRRRTRAGGRRRWPPWCSARAGAATADELDGVDQRAGGRQVPAGQRRADRGRLPPQRRRARRSSACSRSSTGNDCSDPGHAASCTPDSRLLRGLPPPRPRGDGGLLRARGAVPRPGLRGSDGLEGRGDVADALRARHGPRRQRGRRLGECRRGLGPLGGAVYVHGDRPPRPQRDPGVVPLRRRPDPAPRRHVRPVRVGPAGARPQGATLRMDAPVQRAIRAQASRGLDAFVARHDLGPR